MTCESFDNCTEFMDIVFIVHRTTNENDTRLLNELVVLLASAFDLDRGYTHVAALSYDSWTQPTGRVVVPFGQHSQEDFRSQIENIPSANVTANDMERALCTLNEFLGRGHYPYNGDGDRVDAPNTIIFVTDQIDNITEWSLNQTAQKFYLDIDLDNPFVVIVAVNSTYEDSPSGQIMGTQFDVIQNSFVFQFGWTETNYKTGTARIKVQSLVQKICPLKPRPWPCETTCSTPVHHWYGDDGDQTSYNCTDRNNFFWR